MYSPSDLKVAAQSPKSVVREANRLIYTRFRTHDYNPAGINVFDEDWDNLIILDACRYDAFSRRAELPGTLDYRISRGGATFEFVRGNFANRQLDDTVYLTTNSWFQRLRDEIDSRVYDLIDLHMGDEDGSYHSEEFRVVLPDVLTDHARETAETYPNKRLVIHYIQPHHPFIGPTGREHFHHVSSSFNEVLDNTESATRRLVMRAYRENLDIVLSHVADLLPDLPGKTVITADHGEMLGDRHEYVPMSDYGHHEGIYNTPLTKVPWHVVENGDRKRIVAEEPVTSDDVDLDRLEQRLEDLGYKI